MKYSGRRHAKRLLGSVRPGKHFVHFSHQPLRAPLAITILHVTGILQAPGYEVMRLDPE
jgi:hypothetical protein